MPVTYQQIYEEQTERLYPYPATEPANEEVPIPRKEAFYNENYYEPEVTSTYPQTTPRRVIQYQAPAVQQQIDDEESVRVLPVDYQEPQREVIREQPAVYNQRRQPAKQPTTEEPVTSDEQQKVEITPRPRRPLSRQQVYSPRTTAATERTATTERATEAQQVSRGGASSQQQQPGRRPAFVRRPARPLYTTTSAPPTTTYASRGAVYGGSNDEEQPTQGTVTVRPKSRQDILRARTRRPVTTTAATTTTASPEPSVTRGFARNKELRRVSPTTRSRQEQREREPQQQQTQQQQQADSTQTPRFRIRERTRFNLQPQESQWSTKLNQNSFQPVQEVESRHKLYDEELPQNEPEIVTASAQLDGDQDEDGEVSGIHLINVSAKMAGPVTATGTPGIVTNEVALSQAPPQADETAENSNAPSFAELLNDVMKDFIDDNIQQAGTEGKTVENEILIEEVPSSTTETAVRRRTVNGGRAGANFRKRGRSQNVESFETAESQHINSHVYNSAGFEQLKNIDKAYLHGKNFAEEVKGAAEVEENTAQEATTTAATAAPVELPREEPIVTVQPEVTTASVPETTPALETTSILPIEHETVTPAPTPVDDNDDGQSAEQFYEDEPDHEQVQDPSHGIFADVKRQISDLFAMAENDPETEEIEDDDQYRAQSPTVDRTSTEEPEVVTGTPVTPLNVTTITSSSTDMTPEESESVPNAMPIPTSTSNGITHETEICYRGRCVKTDEKKPKKSKLKPN